MQPDQVFESVAERQSPTQPEGIHICPHPGCGKQQYMAGKLGGCSEHRATRGEAKAAQHVSSARLSGSPPPKEATPVKPTSTSKSQAAKKRAGAWTEKDDAYLMENADKGAAHCAEALGRSLSAVYEHGRSIGARFGGRKGRRPKDTQKATDIASKATDTLMAVDALEPPTTERLGQVEIIDGPLETSSGPAEMVSDDDSLERMRQPLLVIPDDAPSLIWCRYCSRYLAPSDCRRIRRHPLTGYTIIDRSPIETVKCGRAEWGCQPAITWLGHLHRALGWPIGPEGE